MGRLQLECGEDDAKQKSKNGWSQREAKALGHVTLEAVALAVFYNSDAELIEERGSNVVEE